PVIHPHCVKHTLGNIDPEDVHLVLHGTRLLWLYECTALELIVAHCSRSVQERVHFITTTHTQKRICGAVQAWGEFDRFFCLTRPCTRSILTLLSSSRMSSQTAATGVPRYKTSKPRLLVRPRSGPFSATSSRPAIRRVTG